MPPRHPSSAMAKLPRAPVRLSRRSFMTLSRPRRPLSRRSSRSSTCPRFSHSMRSFGTFSRPRIPSSSSMLLSCHSPPSSSLLSRLLPSSPSYPSLLRSSPFSSTPYRKAQKGKKIRVDRRVSGLPHPPFPFLPFSIYNFPLEFNLSYFPLTYFTSIH